MNGVLNIHVVPQQDTLPAKSVRLRGRANLASSLRTMLFVAVSVICSEAISNSCAYGANPPDFKVVVAAVGNYFNSLPDHQPSDLISQKNVTAALDAAEKVGWKVPDGDEVVKLALPDNSFLVRELAKPDGRKFMRKLAKTQGAYNRLDRISTIPNGQSFIRTLIRDPGGATMIEYMATTAGGRNLGRMMGGLNQRGVDLNTPTNRIYTADELLTVLGSTYAAQTASP